jgi:competence protein ComEC
MRTIRETGSASCTGPSSPHLSALLLLVFLASASLMSGCRGHPLACELESGEWMVGRNFSWRSPVPLLARFTYHTDGCAGEAYVYPAGRAFVRFHESHVLSAESGASYTGKFEGMTGGGEVFESSVIEFEGRGKVAGGGLLEEVTICVGWGDAHLLSLPCGGLVLIDCGSRRHLEELRAFLDERVPASPRGGLDALVLTHPHEDHVGGAIGDPLVSGDGVLERYPVERLLMPDIDPVDFTLVDSIVDAASAMEIPVSFLRMDGENGSQDDLLAWDPLVEVRLLHSGAVSGDDNPNNLSLVLKLTFGRIDMLFTGDAEREVERSLLRRFAGSAMLSCEILKLAHHGSHDANSPAFLSAVAPRVSLLSIDSGEVGWSLPSSDVLATLDDLLVDLFRTDMTGCAGADPKAHLSVLTDGEFFEIRRLERSDF